MAQTQKLFPHNHLAYAVPAKPPAELLNPRERRLAIALFVMGMLMYFVVNIHRVAVPGQIFSQLQAEWKVSASAIAGLGTSFMYIYAATQLLVGVLVDRYGGMRVLAAGCAVMTVGALLFACAHAFWMLFASRALIGMGCGCAYLSMVKECARLYPGRRFTGMLGFVVFFGYSGGIAGTFPFVRCVSRFGWRTGMLAVAVAGAVVLAGMALLWRRVRKPPVNRGAVLSLAPYRDGLTNINTLKCLLSTMVTFGVYYVVLTVVGKKFLEDIGGLSATAAALCCSLMVFLSAISNQVTGLISGAGGNRRRGFLLWQTGVVPLGCLLTLAGLVFLRGSPALGPLLAAAFMVIMLTSGFSPIVNAMLLEINPPALTGVAVGLGNFTAYAAVAVLSSVAGGILDAFRGQTRIDAATGTVFYPASAYVVLFGVLLLIGLGAFGLACRLQETRGNNIYDGQPRVIRLFGRFTLRLHT